MGYGSEDEVIAKDGRSELQDTTDVSRKIRCRATWRTETPAERGAELTRMEKVFGRFACPRAVARRRTWRDSLLHARLQLSTADLQIECRWTARVRCAIHPNRRSAAAWAFTSDYCTYQVDGCPGAGAGVVFLTTLIRSFSWHVTDSGLNKTNTNRSTDGRLVDSILHRA